MSPISPGSHSTTLHYGKLIVMRQTFILGAAISSFVETFGLHVSQSGMQEKHSREHGGRVCLDSQSALSGSLVSHLSCTLVYPNCSALSLNTEGGIGSLTPGGGPLCDVLEHLVQLLRAPGGQICQEVAVHTAEKAAQRVALLADRDDLASLVCVSLCLVTGCWCRWW